MYMYIHIMTYFTEITSPFSPTSRLNQPCRTCIPLAHLWKSCYECTLLEHFHRIVNDDILRHNSAGELCVRGDGDSRQMLLLTVFFLQPFVCPNMYMYMYFQTCKCRFAHVHVCPNMYQENPLLVGRFTCTCKPQSKQRNWHRFL